MSGFWVVIAQRPTLPCGTTTASPTCTRRPIQPSSSCASMPVDPEVHPEAAAVDRSTPSTPAIAPSDASPRSVAAPPRPRSAPPSAARRAGPARRPSPTALRPTARRRVGRPRAAVEVRRQLVAAPTVSPSTIVAVGEAQRQPCRCLVVVGVDELQRAARALVVDEPVRLVDEEEAPVAAQAALEQLDLVERARAPAPSPA